MQLTEQISHKFMTKQSKDRTAMLNDYSRCQGSTTQHKAHTDRNMVYHYTEPSPAIYTGRPQHICPYYTARIIHVHEWHPVELRRVVEMYREEDGWPAENREDLTPYWPPPKPGTRLCA
jgi:hypothetical protein